MKQEKSQELLDKHMCNLVVLRSFICVRTPRNYKGKLKHTDNVIFFLNISIEKFHKQVQKTYDPLRNITYKYIFQIKG